MTDPMETLEEFISIDRFDLIMELLAKVMDAEVAANDLGLDSSSAINLVLADLDESLTLAESSLLGIYFERKGDISEADLTGVVKYLTILEGLNMPVKVQINQLDPEQKMMLESSKEFLNSLNQFKKDWAKANSTATK